METRLNIISTFQHSQVYLEKWQNFHGSSFPFHVRHRFVSFFFPALQPAVAAWHSHGFAEIVSNSSVKFQLGCDGEPDRLWSFDVVIPVDSTIDSREDTNPTSEREHHLQRARNSVEIRTLIVFINALVLYYNITFGQIIWLFFTDSFQNNARKINLKNLRTCLNYPKTYNNRYIYIYKERFFVKLKLL